jgi:uncharacterized membrane protein YgcG
MPTIARLIAVASIASLSACSSLSGQVRGFSVDYGTAMAQFQNEQLVTNILRSRDRVPIHFAELGQVNGSLQEQIQLGASIPFGKYVGAAKKEDDFSPQLMFTSSPTFTTSPLDTQAFTVGMMQPIDATYLVDRLRSADPNTRQLLLFLFVESIENADTAEVPMELKGAALLRNTPGDPAFASYIKTLTEKSDFRLVNVFTPIGSPFTLDPKGDSGYKLTDIQSAADETTVHLKTVSTDHYQLFHVWPEQLALCYGPQVLAAGDSTLPTSPLAIDPAIGPRFDLYLNSFKGGKSGNKSGSNGNAGGANASPSGKSGGGGGGAAPAAGLIGPVMPLVGFVKRSDCFAPIYVEAKDQPHSREFQINLRSVRGAIEYLGAVLRTPGKKLLSADKTDLFDLPQVQAPTEGQKPAVHILKVAYGKSTDFAVDDEYTAEAVQILSELVDSLKLSSDVATTKQVQIIP